MMLSIFAVLIVFIAMPASLAVVESWNNAISNEYETYIEFNNDTRATDGYIGGAVNNFGGITYLHFNSTGVGTYYEATFYDKAIFNDSYSRIVLSADDTTDSTSNLDQVWFALNITVEDLINSGATEMKLHVDAGMPVYFKIAYQSETGYTKYYISDQMEINSTTNYSKELNIDLVELLEAENNIGKTGNIVLQLLSYNETQELSPGDIILFDWQFLKKKGNVATIYTVDNLMLGWGVLLFLIGFASTPFFNPLSRDVFPFITKMRKSRAAKKAAAKRKKGKKRSSKKGSKKKKKRR